MPGFKKIKIPSDEKIVSAGIVAEALGVIILSISSSMGNDHLPSSWGRPGVDGDRRMGMDVFLRRFSS